MEKYQATYKDASKQTAAELETLATSPRIRTLSSLSLPEIETAVKLIARFIPAGNVPSLILNGLARLPGRRPPAETARRDVNLLFKGVEAMVDRAVYGTFFAGPAAVIWGYQNLLRIAGKDPQAAFPEGVWQFYADYALREDSARFTVETHGFDTTLGQHNIHPSPANRLTAWVMTAIHTLHEYETWLANEWRERVYCDILQQVTVGRKEEAWYAGRYKAWEKIRPYGRGHDAANSETYARYRRRHFDTFLREALDKLDGETRYRWSALVQEAKQGQPAYQSQLSLLAYLDPSAYGELRRPVGVQNSYVGLIYKNQYYLIPACHPHRQQPPDVADVQAQVAAILTGAIQQETTLLGVTRLSRRTWAELTGQLSQVVQDDLAQLRRAPILINADMQLRGQPLSTLRQAERGIGGHPLTIFNSESSFIFDFSHIFFDGIGATALAEILTREALAWAVYLSGQVAAKPHSTPTVTPLALNFTVAEREMIRAADSGRREVSAETTAVNLSQLLRLRRLFKVRSDLLHLTVNDLLVLYRAMHAVTYQPSATVTAAVAALAAKRGSGDTAVALTQAVLAKAERSPTIFIPIDATRADPKERVYPLVFEVPLYELDLLLAHDRTLDYLKAYETAEPAFQAEAYGAFQESQRNYLGLLASFGQVFSKAKEMAHRGGETSQGAIRLLAHLPKPLQTFLDQIPNRFDVLNDLIKGREVFSNVGAVVPSSTICRFNTAKDDNDKKALSWGVVTDATGVMHISLRDFRPHVAALTAINEADLATLLVTDYLEAYATGFNAFVAELCRISETSHTPAEAKAAS